MLAQLRIKELSLTSMQIHTILPITIMEDRDNKKRHLEDNKIDLVVTKIPHKIRHLSLKSEELPIYKILMLVGHIIQRLKEQFCNNVYFIYRKSNSRLSIRGGHKKDTSL